MLVVTVDENSTYPVQNGQPFKLDVGMWASQMTFSYILLNSYAVNFYTGHFYEFFAFLTTFNCIIIFLFSLFMIIIMFPRPSPSTE